MKNFLILSSSKSKFRWISAGQVDQGIRGVPAIFINGIVVKNVLSRDFLR
jgi:hypothetical protein